MELALVLPLLLALVSAAIDGSYALHQFGMIAAAAEAAQRKLAIVDTGAGHCGGSPPPSYADLARDAAREVVPHLEGDKVQAAVWYVEPSCDGRMRTLGVSLTYPLTAFTPWLAPLLGHRRVTGQALGVVEEVAPAWWGQGDMVRAQAAQISAQQQQIASLSQTVDYYYAQWQQANATISTLSQAADYYYAQWQSALTWTYPWLGRGGPDNGPH